MVTWYKTFLFSGGIRPILIDVLNTKVIDLLNQLLASNFAYVWFTGVCTKITAKNSNDAKA